MSNVRTDRLAVALAHAPGMARDVDKVDGTVFRAGVDLARRKIEEFDPELVVLVGPDHLRTFSTITPAYAVVARAEGGNDAGATPGTYDIPYDLAMTVGQRLLDAGVDCALVRDVTLDHGFGLTAFDLFGGVGVRPTLPIFVNCADAPLGPFGRAVEVGEALHPILDELDQRILFVASGGLSHAPPSLTMGHRDMTEEERRHLNITYAPQAAEKIDPEWDAMFLAAMAADDVEVLRSMTDVAAAGGSGAEECRTWALVRAAVGHPLATVTYEAVPKWITGMGLSMSAWAV